MQYRRYFVMGWVLVSADCSSNEGDGSHAGIDAGITPDTGSITCMIDGVPWTSAGSTIVAFMNPGFLGVAASERPLPDPGRSIHLSVQNVTGPGTFSLADGGQAIIAVGSHEEWIADAVNGGGVITITTLTASRATGTFRFVAEALRNKSAIGTKTVAAGTFDVKL